MIICILLFIGRKNKIKKKKSYLLIISMKFSVLIINIHQFYFILQIEIYKISSKSGANQILIYKYRLNQNGMHDEKINKIEAKKKIKKNVVECTNSFLNVCACVQ